MPVADLIQKRNEINEPSNKTNKDNFNYKELGLKALKVGLIAFNALAALSCLFLLGVSAICLSAGLGVVLGELIPNFCVGFGVAIITAGVVYPILLGLGGIPLMIGFHKLESKIMSI